MQIDSQHPHHFLSVIPMFSDPVDADRWSWCRSQCVQGRRDAADALESFNNYPGNYQVGK